MAGICLVLTAPTLRENMRQYRRYRSFLDYVELRVDLLDQRELDSIRHFPEMCDLPVICTIRRQRDGGRYIQSETDRMQLFQSVTDAGFSYVDLELDFGETHPATADTLLSSFRANGTKVIRSYHDFEGVPEDLDGLYAQLSGNPEEIPKIAVYPKCFSDAVRLYDAARSWRDGPKIVLGMGTFGFFTRILAEKLGSLFTFTSPAGESAAPGHIDPETLTRVYRYRSIRRSTRILAVIADPVMHSRSPWIHNPALDACDLDAVYIPIHVDNPDYFFDTWDRLDIDGISVTIPHKERVIPLLASTDDAVKAIGSCNTVIRGDDGFRGSNTDVPGFIASIRGIFSDDMFPGRAVVIGAGGTSRAIIFALRNSGVEVLIVNRTVEKARTLAEEYSCEWAPLSIEAESRLRAYSELIVQTTSAGMPPQAEIDPLEFYEFSGSEAVYDVVYTPSKTKFLERAEAAGCRVMNGWQMLLEQAYLQFFSFTGKEYPRSVRIGEPE